MTYGHLQADCLYTGISSGPNARYRVWESLYLLPFTYASVEHSFVFPSVPIMAVSPPAVPEMLREAQKNILPIFRLEYRISQRPQSVFSISKSVSSQNDHKTTLPSCTAIHVTTLFSCPKLHFAGSAGSQNSRRCRKPAF